MLVESIYIIKCNITYELYLVYQFCQYLFAKKLSNLERTANKNFMLPIV